MKYARFWSAPTSSHDGPLGWSGFVDSVNICVVSLTRDTAVVGRNVHAAQSRNSTMPSSHVNIVLRAGKLMLPSQLLPNVYCTCHHSLKHICCCWGRRQHVRRHRKRSRPASSGTHFRRSSGGSRASSDSRISASLFLQAIGSYIVSQVCHQSARAIGYPRTAAQQASMVPCRKQLELPACSLCSSQCEVCILHKGLHHSQGAPHAEVDEQQRLAVLEGLGVCSNIVNMRVPPAQSDTKWYLVTGLCPSS